MKALTVRQPWASLIIDGTKTVENRSKPTKHRGPLLIHAGKSTETIRAMGLNPDDYTLGAIIGQVELVDCVSNGDARVRDNPYTDHTAGGYCWIVSAPRKFDTPIPASGSLSFFEVEIASA